MTSCDKYQSIVFLPLGSQIKYRTVLWYHQRKNIHSSSSSSAGIAWRLRLEGAEQLSVKHKVAVKQALAFFTGLFSRSYFSFFNHILKCLIFLALVSMFLQDLQVTA
jgi:hypothetical protein